MDIRRRRRKEPVPVHHIPYGAKNGPVFDQAEECVCRAAPRGARHRAGRRCRAGRGTCAVSDTARQERADDYAAAGRHHAAQRQLGTDSNAVLELPVLTPTPSPTPVPHPTPDPSLYEGVEDSERVTELQTRLMDLGISIWMNPRSISALPPRTP